MGFGAWHVLDSIVVHGLLRWHRINPASDQRLLWDLVFLGVGIAAVAAGFLLRRQKGGSGSRTTAGAGAMRYGLARWDALQVYLDDGTVEIENNAVELAIRPIAVGRNNWLFAGSDAGGERTANILTLIETAKFNVLSRSDI